MTAGVQPQVFVSSRAPIRVSYIDALRGWAILGVLCYHTNAAVRWHDSVVGFFASEGWRGVQLFFVVSAFTLFRSLRTRADRSPEPWAAFFIRRFLRLAPMFYVGIAVYWWRLHLPFNAGVAARAALTALFLHGWRPDTINFSVPGGWSIAVEAMFYALLPALFITIRTLRAAILWFLISCVVAAVFDLNGVIHGLYGRWSNTTTYGDSLFVFRNCWLPSQLPVFAAGILLYFVVKIPPSELRILPRNPVLRIILGFAVCMASTIAAPSRPVLAIGYILVISGLAERPVQFLVNGPLVFIGTVSFSVYLWHFIVLWSSWTWLVGPTGLLVRWPIPLQFACLLGVTLAVTLPLSALTYRWVELPGQSFANELIERWINPTRRLPTVAAISGGE